MCCLHPHAGASSPPSSLPPSLRRKQTALGSKGAASLTGSGPRRPGSQPYGPSRARRARPNSIFPAAHRAELYSTSPLERLHDEIRPRTNVIGIFPNEDAIARLNGAVFVERNDEWAVARRRISLESASPVSSDLTVKLLAVAP